MSIKTYRAPQPESFQAIELTAKTFGDAVKWMLDSGYFSFSVFYGHKLQLTGWPEVGPGSWLGYRDGKFFTLSPKQMEVVYEVVE